MAHHNPFIDKNGQIRFPDNTDLVRHVEKWAKVRGDQLAYRFLDFSTERDGVARDISWSEFGARNRAVGARLQQVTQPGDRVAILCPQSLVYLRAFFARACSVPRRRRTSAGCMRCSTTAPRQRPSPPAPPPRGFANSSAAGRPRR